MRTNLASSIHASRNLFSHSITRITSHVECGSSVIMVLPALEANAWPSKVDREVDRNESGIANCCSTLNLALIVDIGLSG